MPIKVKGNPELEKLYPDEFPNQCACLKNICPECGNRYPSGIVLVCPVCGAKRPRCQNKHMANEEVCRTHVSGRPYSLYTKLAAQINDASLEEFVERETYDLSQEFALAKIALSAALENQQITSKELMENLNSFFTIAQKKKRIEEGDVINVQWNDELVVALRKRWRKTLIALEGVLIDSVKEIPNVPEDFDDEFWVKKVMTRVKEQSKLLGNSITVPKK